MNIVKISKDNQRLYIQRNILLLVVVVLLISNVFLSIWIFGKKEKLVIIPAIKEEVEIRSGKERFSESYIEQMTIFFIELLLDLTPENIKYKSQILLKHVVPENYHSIAKHYKEEEERHKRYRLATKFDMVGMKILEGGERVEIEGVLSSRFGEESMKQKQVKYEVKYKKGVGRLLLEGFRKKEDK